MYNSIQEELWRIFTFYAVHADPTTPELWRPVIFLKFCKECQITSKGLPANSVELEIAKLSRSRQHGEFNPTIVLNFTDFLQLLNILSVKVYPKDAPETAVTRLIFENVLLLANRRTPSNDMYDLQNENACEVVTTLFGKALYNIFKHYLNKADTRRQHAVTNEKIKQKQLAAQHNLSPTLIPQSAELIVLKERAKTEKDVFSFKEYVQFCHDYSLKSTTLLTAIQVAEIFLNLVPIPGAGGGHTDLGMTFDLFLQSIVYMAQVAYRDSPLQIDPARKVKALLLYMWKAVNDTSKTKQLLQTSRSSNITSMAGSYNYFGAGLFSDQFLANWAKEGYAEYTTPEDAPELAGRAALVAAGAADERAVTHHDADEVQSGASAPSATPGQKKVGIAADSGACAGSGFGLQGNGQAASNGSNINLELNTNAGFEATRPTKAPGLLKGRDLAQLLRRKPELAEFLRLEIESLKWHQQMSRSSAVAEDFNERRLAGTSGAGYTAV